MPDLITGTNLCESIPVAMMDAWMTSVCLSICNFMFDACIVMLGYLGKVGFNTDDKLSLQAVPFNQRAQILINVACF